MNNGHLYKQVKFDVYISIKWCLVTIITPLYKLGKHPDTILCFILIIYPLIFISLFSDFPLFLPFFLFFPFPHSLRFRSHLEFPQQYFGTAQSLFRTGCCSLFHSSIADFYPSAFPAFKSKACIAYPHLS